MPVEFNNQVIVPAPLVSIGTDFQRYDDGLYKKSLFTVSLKGKLFADRGGVFQAENGSVATVDYSDGILYDGRTPNDFTNSPSLGSQSDPSSSWSAQDVNTGYIKQQALHKKLLALYAAFDPARGGGNLQDKVAQPVSGEAGRPGFLVVTGWSSGLGQSNSRIECYARVKSIQIPEGPWNNVIDYDIVLEAEYIRIYDGSSVKHTLGSDSYDVPVEESWSFEPSDDDERYFKISRNISAQSLGKRSPTDSTVYVSGWILARNAVEKALSPNADPTNAVTYFGLVGSGFGTNSYQPTSGSKFLSSGSNQPTADVFIFPSSSFDFIQGTGTANSFSKFVNNSGGFICYNPKRTISIDKQGGKVMASENWSCATYRSFLDTQGLSAASGSFALEDFEISVVDTSDTKILDVTVRGTITGVRFSTSDSVVDKFTRAQNVFNNISANNYAVIKNRINSQFGVSGSYSTALYPSGVPLTNHTRSEIGKNPSAGTITYALNYMTKDFVDITKLTCTGVTTNTKKAFALIRDHSITVKDNGPAHLSAETPVFNRAAGPIIYAIGSTSKATRTISISANFDRLPASASESNVGASGMIASGSYMVPNNISIVGPVTLPTTQQIFEAYNCVYNLWDSASLKLKGPLFLDSVESEYDVISGKWNGSITISSSN